MEIDLKELLLILLGKIKIIIGVTVLCAVGCFLITSFVIQPKYQASGTMYVYNNGNRQNTTITSADMTTSQQLISTYIVIMQSDLVLEKVAADTNLGYTPAEISRMFAASALNNTEVFEVRITNHNPQHAQIIANSFLKVSPAEIIRVVKAGAVEVIDEAVLPTQPTSPNVKVNTLIGALLGVVLSSLVVIVLEMFDSKIKSEEDLVAVLTIPVIGVIPDIAVDGHQLGGKHYGI